MTGGDAIERLRFALARDTGGLDDLLMTDLERMTVGLGMMQRTALAPLLTVPMIEAHLGTLATLMERSGPQHRRPLGSLAAETAGMIGRLRWSAGDFEGAQRFWSAGLDTAEEAGDRAQGAYLLASLAELPLHREDPAARLSRLVSRTPKGIGVGDATPNTLGWVWSLYAGAYALQGDLASFQQASDLAQTHLARSVPSPLASPDVQAGQATDAYGKPIQLVDLVPDASLESTQRPRVPILTRAYLAQEQASQLVLLGRPEAAEASLDSVPPESFYGRLHYWQLRDRASIGRAKGEPEEFAHFARQALEGASTAGVRPVVESTQRLVAQASDWRHEPAMREVVALAAAM
jgi:hypothetical protein